MARNSSLLLSLVLFAGTVYADGASNLPGTKPDVKKPSCAPEQLERQIPITVNCGNLEQIVEARPEQPKDSKKNSDKKRAKADDADNCCSEKNPLVEAVGYIAWPFVALFAILFYGRDASRFISRKLLSLQKVKGGGVELEFSPEDAKDVRQSFGKTVLQFIGVADDAYRQQVRIHQIYERMKPAVDAVIKLTGPNATTNYRATVHVPDIVFNDHLYQLLNYTPSGGGNGRRFSIRYGILGRAWRLGASIGSGNALAINPPDSPKDSDAQTLVSEWGMTYDEARAWQQLKKSFLCVVLMLHSSSFAKDDQPATGKAVGILYIDADDENAFGNNEQATSHAVAASQNPAVMELATAVEGAMAKLREGGTFLEI